MQFHQETTSIQGRLALPKNSVTLRPGSLYKGICLFLLAIGATSPACLAQCRDDAVDIQQDAAFSNGVRYFISSHRTLEATVQLKCDFIQNGTPSHPLPYSFCVTKDYKKFEILRLTQTNPREQWHFGNYFYRFVMGVPSDAATVDCTYLLPYSPSQHFQIGQSYFGTFSHQKGTPEEYAIDINMPEGTPVSAARAGIVIACRDDSSTGGNSELYKECSNYVYIKHGDGTYAVYAHLRFKGVAVKLGQAVAAGTLLGYSGQTGSAACPHLHFMVYRVAKDADIKTIPFRTRTADGVVPQLLEGQTY